MGTLLGLGLGVGLQHGLASQGLDTLGIPWALVIAMLVASMVAPMVVGGLAAVAPAIRASRLQIHEAIAGT